MLLPTITIDGKELTLYSVRSLPSGYGHRKIMVDLIYKGVHKEFSRTTNNMHSFDEEVMVIEDYTERQIAMYGLVAYALEDAILDWMYELDNPSEE